MRHLGRGLISSFIRDCSLRIFGMISKFFAVLVTRTKYRLFLQQILKGWFSQELQVLTRQKQQKHNIQRHIESLYEKIYQQNYQDQYVNEQVLGQFELILKENYYSPKRISRSEYSDKLSQAERIIEEIFDEFWPEYQEEDMISLETELTKAELEFEHIVKLQAKSLD